MSNLLQIKPKLHENIRVVIKFIFSKHVMIGEHAFYLPCTGFFKQCDCDEYEV